MKTRHVLILAAALVIGLAAYTVGQSTVTWEGILPGISTELGGTYAINIANTASTVGLDVSEETALTNTVNGTIKSTHTTSGTPAAGIGNGYWVYQGTAAANTEKVMELNAVITDATATSEDADFVVELMAAGAASAEAFRISSTGDATFQGVMDLASGTTIADGDTTPDVSDGYWFTTSSNTGATAITDLDNPTVGQQVCLIGGSATNSSTIGDSGNFALTAAMTLGVDDNICFYVQADNDYIEISRADN